MSATDGIRQKIDVTFVKEGWARFCSHHDILRSFERAIRRSGLPVRWTAGFNPRPRLVFLTPTGVGVASRAEHVEIEFADPVGVGEAVERLGAQLMPGLRVLDGEALPKRRRGRKAVEMDYALHDCGPRDGGAALEALASAPKLPIERRSDKGAKTVDIAPSLASFRRETDGTVRARVRVQPKGTVRPDELAKLAAERCGGDAAAVRVVKESCAVGW
ncbi:MAG: TIGR03936 family radical SAM-associated protein [Planctomycetota bacterium]